MKTIVIFLTIINLILPSVANDNFADRNDLGANPAISFEASLSEASIEPFEPGHFAIPSQNTTRSRWFTWSAPEDGWYRINIHSSSPLDLAIYRGSKLEKLIALARAWRPLPGEPTTLPFFAEAQESLQIAIATRFFDDAKPFSFTLEKTDNPAANDLFENRTQLDEPFDDELQVETHGSSMEADEPRPARLTSTGSIWWSLNPTQDTSLGLTVLNPNNQAYGSRIVIYEGDQLTMLEKKSEISVFNVHGNSGSPLSIEVTGGTEYQICVLHPVGGNDAPAQFKLRITSDRAVPRNDDLADATILTGRGPHSIDNVTLNAGRETGELPHLGGGPDRILRKTTWWKWTAPLDGMAAITSLRRLSNSPNYAVLYKLGDDGILTKLAEVNDDVEHFSAQAGSSYFIVTGHDTANSGSSERFILFQPELGIPPGTPIEMGSIDSFSFEGTNFSDPPHPNQWTWTPLTGGSYRIGPEPNVAALAFAVQQQDLSGE